MENKTKKTTKNKNEQTTMVPFKTKIKFGEKVYNFLVVGTMYPFTFTYFVYILVQSIIVKRLHSEAIYYRSSFRCKCKTNYEFKTSNCVNYSIKDCTHIEKIEREKVRKRK